MKQKENKIISDLVGWVLRIGVALSMLLTGSGLLLYLLHPQNSHTSVDYSSFKDSGLWSFHHFGDRLAHFDSIALMQLGILLLISTPITRVIITLIGFWIERDLRYTLVASLVLLILLCSFFIGATH